MLSSLPEALGKQVFARSWRDNGPELLRQVYWECVQSNQARFFLNPLELSSIRPYVAFQVAPRMSPDEVKSNELCGR